VENPDPKPEAVVTVIRRGKPSKTTLGALHRRRLGSRSYHSEHRDESSGRNRIWRITHASQVAAYQESLRNPAHRKYLAFRAKAKRAGWKPPEC
jgi:hypothetical protein